MIILLRHTLCLCRLSMHLNPTPPFADHPYWPTVVSVYLPKESMSCVPSQHAHGSTHHKDPVLLRLNNAIFLMFSNYLFITSLRLRLSNICLISLFLCLFGQGGKGSIRSVVLDGSTNLSIANPPLLGCSRLVSFLIPLVSSGVIGGGTSE